MKKTITNLKECATRATIASILLEKIYVEGDRLRTVSEEKIIARYRKSKA